MAEGVELSGGEKGGVGDGAAMVGDLDEGVFFGGVRGVEDIDEAIGAAGEDGLRG